jgi:hypothetical protein
MELVAAVNSMRLAKKVKEALKIQLYHWPGRGTSRIHQQSWEFSEQNQVDTLNWWGQG